MAGVVSVWESSRVLWHIMDAGVILVSQRKTYHSDPPWADADLLVTFHTKKQRCAAHRCCGNILTRYRGLERKTKLINRVGFSANESDNLFHSIQGARSYKC